MNYCIVQLPKTVMKTFLRIEMLPSCFHLLCKYMFCYARFCFTLPQGLGTLSPRNGDLKLPFHESAFENGAK